MARGTLRIYLGAAPGVGKTFAMLNEGRRRHERGTDVVVGFVETHGRPKHRRAARRPRGRAAPAASSTAARRSRRWTSTRSSRAARRSRSSTSSPTPTCPARRNEKRWQDVEELLDAGIDVISTVNIQHLESLNDVVERITGVEAARDDPRRGRAARRPDRARRHDARGAAPADGPRQHLPAEQVDAALGNYFRVGNLAALRELALLWVADRVDEALAGLPRAARHRPALGDARAGRRRAHRRARTARRSSGAPRAWRPASQGDLLGVHVRPGDGLAAAAAEPARASSASCSRSSAARTTRSSAPTSPRRSSDFARAENATQLVLGASRRSRWHRAHRAARSSTASSRARASIDVHVISTDDGSEATSARRARRADPTRAPARAGSAARLGARRGRPAAAHAGALEPRASDLGLPSVLLLFLLLVVVVAASAASGRRSPRPSAASCSPTSTSRRRSTRSRSPRARTSSRWSSSSWSRRSSARSSSLAARRAADGAARRAEAETLAQLAGTVLAEPLADLLAQPRGGCSGSTRSPCCQPHGGRAGRSRHCRRPGSRVGAAGGRRTPSPLDERDLLLAVGGAVSHELRQTAGAAMRSPPARSSRSQHRRLQARGRRPPQASPRPNELRTALLAAVSHDLRTPLASIKASVTSLLQRGRGLDADARHASSSRRSTRRPTGSTRSSATCST